jgi:hypothetical protein
LCVIILEQSADAKLTSDQATTARGAALYVRATPAKFPGRRTVSQNHHLHYRQKSR